jgi:hypothetical protein
MMPMTAPSVLFLWLGRKRRKSGTAWCPLPIQSREEFVARREAKSLPLNLR